VKICLFCEARFDSDDWQCPKCGRSPKRNGFLRFSDSAGPSEAFPEGSFAELPPREDTSFWFSARNELIDWALRKYLPRTRSFFELGCGTGVVLAALHKRRPELRFAGGEPFAAGLAAARSRLPDVPLYQLDGRFVPFDKEFDVVGAFDVLEHVEEDMSVLAEMHKAVKPGGGILVSVPQHPWLWSAADEFSGHRRRYRGDELVEKIESSGFRVLRRTSFVSLLLPVVAVSRWRGRGKSEYDPWTEYRLSRGLERAFGSIMAAERRLISKGISFRAGSSFLVAAERR
jgi:SAM-dependent methyltransferase